MAWKYVVPSACMHCSQCFFKFNLEIMFCEDVQSRLRFCLDHYNCVKMAAFQFYLQSGKLKVWPVGDDSHVVFVKKILWWKRECETARYHDATASFWLPKFNAKSLQFHEVTVKHHSSMRNWLFGLPGWILCEQSPDITENESTLLILLFTCRAVFQSRRV
jgi:hypothetical protein